MRKSIVSLAAAGLLSGCVSLAPDYERPASPVPSAWPDSAAAATSADAEGSVAEIGWRTFFRDPRLNDLVALALENNRDLRIATLNIERARGAYRIQRAEQLPTLDATGAESAQRVPASISTTGDDYISRQFSAEVGVVSYELDLFGRVRSLKNQALQDYLAQMETQRATQISLVGEVANAWLQLAADQALLRLAVETHDSRRQSLELTQRSQALGVASALDLAQARSSVESARADVAVYTAQVAQDRNALQYLVGTDVPAGLWPDDTVEVLAVLGDLTAGVDSSVLWQRPDVLAAEHSLIGANANIGAARAAFFPQITLTGSGGTASADLGDLFDGGTGTWSFMPQISIPIFAGGANRAALDVAKAEQQIAVATYDQSVQTAFREVSDALAQRATIDEQVDALTALAEATQQSFDLSEARYRKGVDSYLSLLDAQRSLYAAQQQLISVQLARQTNLVTLYKVLGGGWAADGA